MAEHNHQRRDGFVARADSAVPSRSNGFVARADSAVPSRSNGFVARADSAVPQARLIIKRSYSVGAGLKPADHEIGFAQLRRVCHTVGYSEDCA